MAGMIQTTWNKILNTLGLHERINTIDQQIAETFKKKNLLI